jgi:hypothetical protein
MAIPLCFVVVVYLLLLLRPFAAPRKTSRWTTPVKKRRLVVQWQGNLLVDQKANKVLDTYNACVSMFGKQCWVRASLRTGRTKAGGESAPGKRSTPKRQLLFARTAVAAGLLHRLVSPLAFLRSETENWETSGARMCQASWEREGVPCF